MTFTIDYESGATIAKVPMFRHRITGQKDYPGGRVNFTWRAKIEADNQESALKQLTDCYPNCVVSSVVEEKQK